MHHPRRDCASRSSVSSAGASGAPRSNQPQLSIAAGRLADDFGEASQREECAAQGVSQRNRKKLDIHRDASAMGSRALKVAWTWTRPPTSPIRPQAQIDALDVVRRQSGRDSSGATLPWRDLREEIFLHTLCWGGSMQGRSLRLTNASTSTSHGMTVRRRWRRPSEVPPLRSAPGTH